MAHYNRNTGVTNWSNQYDVDMEAEERVRKVDLGRQQTKEEWLQSKQPVSSIGKSQGSIGQPKDVIYVNDKGAKGRLKQEIQYEIQTGMEKNTKKIDFAFSPSIYRRDQTFESKQGKSAQEVLDAVTNVLESYNERKGLEKFLKQGSDGPVQERFELHESRDEYKGKFAFTFCNGPLCCQGAVNLYKTKTPQLWMEVTFNNGSRECYYMIFDIITRDLMGNSKDPKNYVLEGLVCKDFYPLAPMGNEYEYSDDEYEEEPLDDEEKLEVKEIITERMDLWRETRFYEQKRDGLTELIELLDAYRPLFEECYIDDKGARFEKAWNKAIRRESDMPMARCMLMFMEKLITKASPALKRCMNSQPNGVYSHVFSCWSNWRRGGRFAPSWIMEEQILRTLKAMQENDIHARLGGGRNPPRNYLSKNVEPLGLEYVMSFPVNMEDVLGLEFSDEFNQARAAANVPDQPQEDPKPTLEFVGIQQPTATPVQS